jgi:hypothetical protein
VLLRAAMQESPLARPGTATRYHVCPYRDLRFDLSAAAGGRSRFRVLAAAGPGGGLRTGCAIRLGGEDAFIVVSR